MTDGFRVAIVGRPNAGKSSLLNRLAGSDVAIVTEHAGTTRDVIEVRLDIGATSSSCKIRRACGSRATRRSHRHRPARATASGADLILWLDEEGRFEDVELPLDRPTIRIRTKSDLPGPERGGSRTFDLNR